MDSQVSRLTVIWLAHLSDSEEEILLLKETSKSSLTQMSYFDDLSPLSIVRCLYLGCLHKRIWHLAMEPHDLSHTWPTDYIPI
jgi:hypothetical protein